MAKQNTFPFYSEKAGKTLVRKTVSRAGAQFEQGFWVNAQEEIDKTHRERSRTQLSLDPVAKAMPKPVTIPANRYDAPPKLDLPALKAAPQPNKPYEKPLPEGLLRPVPSEDGVLEIFPRLSRQSERDAKEHLADRQTFEANVPAYRELAATLKAQIGAGENAYGVSKYTLMEGGQQMAAAGSFNPNTGEVELSSIAFSERPEVVLHETLHAIGPRDVVRESTGLYFIEEASTEILTQTYWPSIDKAYGFSKAANEGRSAVWHARFTPTPHFVKLKAGEIKTGFKQGRYGGGVAYQSQINQFYRVAAFADNTDLTKATQEQVHNLGINWSLEMKRTPSSRRLPYLAAAALKARGIEKVDARVFKGVQTIIQEAMEGPVTSATMRTQLDKLLAGPKLTKRAKAKPKME